MKIETLSTKFIKPFVSTHATLRDYKIGFTDELAPVMNLSLVLFFPLSINHNMNIISGLETSLEKTLTRFYPLAGRYVEETHSVDFNDQGIEFIHAKVNIQLQDILGPEVNFKLVDKFIPLQTHTADQYTDPILKTQVTMFECGGAAIGVSVMHRIVDASTLSTFLNEWAAINREGSDSVFAGPGFNSSSLFPARGLRPFGAELPWSISDDTLISKYVTKKFSFREIDISKMKGTHRWSKVQLVSAVIWKALIDLDRVIHEHPRESILLQPVNLRGKTASMISKHSCGNMWGIFSTESKFTQTTESLADLIRVSVKKTISNYSKVCHDSDECQTMILNSFSQTASFPDSTNVVTLTCWCNFSFYEADFGFGKPSWVTCGSIPVKNTAYLMDDAAGNGVEAIMCMEVKDVPYFEQALNINDFCT